MTYFGEGWTSWPNPCDGCVVEGTRDDWYHAAKCPVAKTLRDSYCTPEWFAKLLGRFSMDPCSNPRSLIQADRRLMVENGDDGLATSWVKEDIFVNGPFSNLLPWAQKLSEARSFAFLCNTDHSTRWWKAAVAAGGHFRFDLDSRLQFDPPPHIRKTTNNKPQTLLCNERAFSRLRAALVDVSTFWTSYY